MAGGWTCLHFVGTKEVAPFSDPSYPEMPFTTISADNHAKYKPEILRTLYKDMVRLRMVEEAIADRYGEQEMRCPVHLSTGQEAVAVGACAALRRKDLVISTHRCHGHYLAKGGDLRRMMAEIHGKATGCVGGRGGSMHLMDSDAGVVLSLPVVGSSIPIGVGIALAAQREGKDDVCMVFFGDAAVEEGVFHESANFAALRNIPIVFVCENNLYSVYTSLSERQPNRPLAELGRAHGMPSLTADGNDVLAVYESASEAVDRARAGDGPSFLVFDTYRWREHCGPNFDNDIGYRTEEEFTDWKDRCPIERFSNLLGGNGVINDAFELNLARTVNQEIDEAFAFAKSSALPSEADALTHLYA